MGAPNPPGVDALQGGTLKKSRAQRLDFTGAGVTVTDSGDRATVNIPGGGAGGGVNTQNQGVAVDTPATAINFSGNGVAATGGAGTTTVTVKGDRQGLLANRGLASDWPGTVYWATDTQLAYVSDGANWTTMSPLTTTGDLPYWDGTKTNRLAVGQSWQALGVSGGVPAWNNRAKVLFQVGNFTAQGSIATAASLIGGFQQFLAANELAVGDVFHLRAGVKLVNNNAGATASTMSVSIIFKTGAITGTIQTTVPLSIASAATSTRNVLIDTFLVCTTANSGSVSVWNGGSFTHTSAANAVALVLANGQAEFLSGVGLGSGGNNGPYLVDLQVNSTLNDVGCTGQCIGFSVEKVSP